MESLESDMTERLHFHFSLSCIGEGNGNPLQCSCLENPRDGGAWWAAIYGIAQSRTRLKQLSSSSSDSSLWFRFVFLWHLMMLTIFSCIFSLASCILSKIKCFSSFAYFLIGLFNLFFCSALRVPFLATWFAKIFFFFQSVGCSFHLLNSLSQRKNF